MATRSDIKAKEKYKKQLEKEGYKNVNIISKGADLEAYKHGKKYYFEIKKTSKQDNYFGAATLTEWEKAYENPKRYFFIVCLEKGKKFIFKKYTLKEFEKYCTIPPYKVYFNIPLAQSNKKTVKRKKKDGAIRMNEIRFKKMLKSYNDLKRN